MPLILYNYILYDKENNYNYNYFIYFIKNESYDNLENFIYAYDYIVN